MYDPKYDQKLISSVFIWQKKKQTGMYVFFFSHCNHFQTIQCVDLFNRTAAWFTRLETV